MVCSQTRKYSGLPSNNSYFLSSVNLHRQTFEHEWQPRPVSHVDIIEFDRALYWPLRSGFVSRNLVWRLLRNDIVPAVLHNYPNVSLQTGNRS